jgi:hypothetical protein
MLYRVVWEIDIDAQSPDEAARGALTIHRDPFSIATHFTVRDETGHLYDVDLPPEVHSDEKPRPQSRCI